MAAKRKTTRSSKAPKGKAPRPAKSAARETAGKTATKTASGAAGTPALLFTGRYLDSPEAAGMRNWDATPDGERFILVKRPPELQARRVNVVLNWLDELQVKVPTR